MARHPSLHAQRKPAAVQPYGRELQPVLLERLTDDAVDQTREPDGSFLLTRSMLRDSVLRDLRWLLNTIHMETTDDLSAFPHVRQSVVNYGIGALAGQLIAELEWPDIESSIREAIIQFEPRILADSLHVRCLADPLVQGHHNILSLELSGELWCIPYPMEFIFRSEIDLECGYIVLRSLGGE